MLKRVALMRYGRDKVAGLQGEAWFALLTADDETFFHDKHLREALLSYPYHLALPAEIAKPSLDKLMAFAIQWVKKQSFLKRGAYEL